MVRIKLILLVATVTALLLGCSSGGGSGGDGSGSAPTLQSVNIEPQSAAAGIEISLSGDFSYTDPDGDLGGGSFNYRYEGVDYSIPLPSDLNGLTSATITFFLDVILSDSTGELEVLFWLVDGAGHRSNTVTGIFTQLWTRQFGTTLEDIGYGVAADGSGNVIVAGATEGDLDGEINSGLNDLFVTKYTAGAIRSWTQLLGSSGDDVGRAVAVDSSDNIYVAGETSSSSLGGQTSLGGVAGFLSKYDSSGTLQWTRLQTIAEGMRAYAVAVSPTNDIYVAGSASGDYGGDTNAGGSDAYLAKYAADGSLVWGHLLGATSIDTAYALSVDSSGNIYLAGSTDGVLGTDPSPGDPGVNFDAFVAKYLSDGSLDWVSQLGTSCSEMAEGVDVDASGNIAVVGRIYSCAFDGNTAGGGYDAYLAYLNSSGDMAWVKQFGGVDTDRARSVVFDSSGNSYVTGYLNSVYSTGDNEGKTIFLSKYDNSGNQLWTGEDNASYNWGNQGLSVTVDGSDNIFLTGTTHGQLDGHVNQTLGEDDAFILKYDTAGVRQ